MTDERGEQELRGPFAASGLPPAVRYGIAGTALAIALALCALPLFHFRPVFIATSLGIGLGAFEPASGGTALRFGSHTSADMVPLAVNALGNEIVVAAGTTAVFELQQEKALWIRSSEPDRPAWIVVGEGRPDVTPGTAPGADAPWARALPGQDAARSGNSLGSPRMLVSTRSRLEYAPWDGDVAWKRDLQRLQRLASDCDAGGEPLRLMLLGDRVITELGTCRTSTRVIAPQGRPTTMHVAVAGEVGGATVIAPRGSWNVDRSIKTFFLGLLAALALIKFAAYGPYVAAIIGIVSFAAGFLTPSNTAFAWLAIATLGVIVGIGRLVAWSARTAARLVGAPQMPVVLSALAAAAALGVFGLTRLDGAIMDWAHREGTRRGADWYDAPSPVLLTGYSLAQGVTLPDLSFGTEAYLNNACPVSKQRTGSLTGVGSTFHWVSDHVCSPDFPESTTDVVFLGGANDDLLVHKILLMEVNQLLGQIMLSLERPRPGWWLANIDSRSARQRAEADLQRGHIARGLSCLDANGTRFAYFHDFLVTDMQAGRGPNRSALSEARHDAVLASGGTFIDLWSELGERAGVAWFNDFIHLSAVGHQEVGVRVCDVLDDAGGANSQSEPPTSAP